MLQIINQAFLEAIIFGFTSIPIHAENQRKLSTNTTICDNELNRYSIIEGIRDCNVFGFDFLPCDNL